MIGAFIFAGGSVPSTDATCDTGTLTAPGMKPSRATVDAGRTSTSTCGMSFSIHASLRNGAAITPTFFSSHSGAAAGKHLDVGVAHALGATQRVRAHHAGDALAEEHDQLVLFLRQAIDELVERRVGQVDRAGNRAFLEARQRPRVDQHGVRLRRALLDDGTAACNT